MHLCHPELIIATRFCMEYQNMPSKGCNVCKTWPLVKVQQHNADAEEIALAACEVSHNIQSSAAYLHGTARHGTKLLEDSVAKLHAFTLAEIRDWKFTHHAEGTPQIRMPHFRLCGPQVVERTTCEHYNHHLPCIIPIILKNSSF